MSEKKEISTKRVKETVIKYTPAQASIMFKLRRGLSNFVQKKYKGESHTEDEWRKIVKKII